MFSQVSVCPLGVSGPMSFLDDVVSRGGYLWYQVPFRGGCVQGMNMSGVRMGMSRGGG